MSPVGKPTPDRDNAPADRHVVTTFQPTIEEVIGMKRLSTLALLALLVAGCRAAVQPSGPDATEAPTTPVAAAPPTATAATRIATAASSPLSP
jgi:hypothetical protein